MQSSGSKETVSLKVDTGAVRSRVTHTEGKRIEYKARTPVGVASVRGTDFTVFSNGKAKVFEGAIAYYKISDFVVPAKASSGSEESEESDSTDDTGAADASGGAGAADAGPATSTTPANEIAESAPKNAQVVGAGQTSTINKNGQTSKPVVEAKQKVSKVKATVASAATKEVLSASLTAAAADAGVVETPAPEPETIVKPTTASVKVKVTIK